MVDIAVVGCGGIGCAHIRACAEVQGLRVTHCVDLDRGKAEAAAALCGAVPLSAVGDLPDAVAAAVVATPPHLHTDPVRELLAGGIPDLVAEVEVRAVGAPVGKHLTTGHPESVEHPVPQSLEEVAVGILLHLEPLPLQEAIILDELRGLIEIHQDANPASGGRLKDRSQQTREIKGGKLSLLRMLDDVLVKIGGQALCSFLHHNAPTLGRGTAHARDFWSNPREFAPPPSPSPCPAALPAPLSCPSVPPRPP